MWKGFLKFGIPLVVLLGVILMMVFASQGVSTPVLDTKGSIATQQKDLLILTTALMMLIIVPMIGMLFFFAYKYRDTNKKSRYTPNWDSHKLLELIWWGIPIIIIGILSVITWQTSHSLDPYRPIQSEGGQLKVQVTALQWKWLFMYPEDGIAVVNEMYMPVGKPVSFHITSDAPMNSFWIPQLGGQIYAMSGMNTQLNLVADQVGKYRGVSANISGEGHANMKFIAHGVLPDDYNKWTKQKRSDKSLKVLDRTEYDKLRQPGSSDVKYYRLDDRTLYDYIMTLRTGNQEMGGQH